MRTKYIAPAPLEECFSELTYLIYNESLKSTKRTKEQFGTSGQFYLGVGR